VGVVVLLRPRRKARFGADTVLDFAIALHPHPNPSPIEGDGL
jgi:hypothetical protein